MTFFGVNSTSIQFSDPSHTGLSKRDEGAQIHTHPQFFSDKRTNDWGGTGETNPVNTPCPHLPRWTGSDDKIGFSKSESSGDTAEGTEGHDPIHGTETRGDGREYGVERGQWTTLDL